MKTGRNKPCPCGSGKKYKRCCLPMDIASGAVEYTKGKESDPKNQHFVPACYLTEFVDPSDGCLWVFSKDGKTKRKQKPESIFKSNHLYTINIKGAKSYRIEKTLANIEGSYADIFRNKIKNKLPLTDEEHVLFCIFVAAQLQRTLRFKRNQENFIQQIIDHGEQITMAHHAEFTQKAEWEEYKKDIHKLELIEGLPFLTNILTQMSLSFLCSTNPKRHWFITSDDPCNMFNPDLQWQRFYGPGFGQKNVQLTLPLSPEITAMFCWANYSGYARLRNKTLEDLNRMTRAHCDKEFVSPKDKKKWIWFNRIPLDPIFAFKALKMELRFFIYDTKSRLRDRKFRKKYERTDKSN